MQRFFSNFASNMKTRISITIFLILSVKLLLAQEAKDTSDLFFRHLELDQVVITGLTGDSRLRETPSPVSVISPLTLQGTASSNIVYAISREPGMSALTTGGSISKPVIRGMGYNRVVVISDAIRQEGQQWGDEHGVEIGGDAVNSVEILKGPASLMYGSDALAGVVIFHPAPIVPPGKMKARLSSEYQTNSGLFHYSLNYGGNINGVVWDAVFSDKYSHSYRNSVNGFVPNSAFHELSANAMVGLNRKWGYSRIRLSYFHLTPGIVEEESDNTGYVPGLPFQQVYHWKAVSDNTINLGPGRLKAIIGFQQNHRQEYEEDPSEYELYFLLNTLNYDIKYIADLAGGWKLASGVGGMFQHSRNFGEEALIPDYSLVDAGLFVTASKSVGNWNFSGGVRGDLRFMSMDVRKRFSGFSASLGAVYNISDAVNLRLNFARGFRAPNIAELSSDGIHEGSFRYELGNLSLVPENSLQGDLGLDFSSAYISGQAAVFYNHVSNYIYLAANGGQAEGMPVFSYYQGNARLFGGELSLDVHPIHRLHIGESFSYVNGRLYGGEYLPMIPAPRLLSEVKWEFTHDGDHKFLNNAYAAIQLDWYMAQNHFYGPAGTESATPGCLLLNFSAGTDIVIKGRKWLSIYFIADNILDTAWQNHLSRLKYMGFYNMGRNFTFKLLFPLL